MLGKRERETVKLIMGGGGTHLASIGPMVEGTEAHILAPPGQSSVYLKCLFLKRVSNTKYILRFVDSIKTYKAFR